MMHEQQQQPQQPMYSAAPFAPSEGVDPTTMGGSPETTMLNSVAGTSATSLQQVRSGSANRQQQQLLRESMGGRGSYIAAMRRTSALPVPQGSVGANPLSSTPTFHAAGGTTGAAAPMLMGPGAVAGAQGGWGEPELAAPPQEAGKEQQELSPAGEDFVHEILAMNTLAMEQCYAALAAGATAKGATAGGAGAMAGAAVASGTPNVTAASEEPMKILSEAYLRLDETSADDFPAPLLDQLKATTLNNMGVVECNRGQPRQALSHFEAARQLEENNDMTSPSVALNTCAAYNALRMFDKATAAALEAIDMLRSLEVQRQRNRRLAAAAAAMDGTGPSWGGGSARAPGAHGTAAGDGTGADAEESTTALLLQAAAAPKIADSQNDALWGAAWNNLAIAQINTTRGSKDTSEHTNSLALFQNAMRATQELLGMHHPMSKAVITTFRHVRRSLRNNGAFKQHRALLRAPLPPVDPREREWEESQVEPTAGHTRHGTLQHQKQQLTITFRGEVTGGQKLTERVESDPYPGAASQPYQRSQHRTSTGRGATDATRSRSRSNKSKKNRLMRTGVSRMVRCMPLGGTLARANVIYGNPHPLLYSPPPPQAADDDFTEQGGAAAAVAAAPHSGRSRPQPSVARYDSPAAWEGGGGGGAPTAGARGGAASSSSRGAAGTHPTAASGRRTPQPPAKGRGQRQEAAPSGRGRGGPGGAAAAASYPAPPPGPPASQSRTPPPAPAASKLLPPIGAAMSASGFAPPPPAGYYAAVERSGEGPANFGASLGIPSTLFGETVMSTASSVYMHRPPPPPGQQQPPHSSHPPSARPGGSPGETALMTHSGTDGEAAAAAAAHVHQSKMLLLATPSGSAGTTYHPLEVGAEGQRQLAPYPASQPPSAPLGDGAGAAHELFRGMWVTADPNYVHRGPRVFGRPAYYTIATTLDVTEEGVGGNTSGAEGDDEAAGAAAAGAVGSAPASAPTDSAVARRVLPTLTYSGSSDEDEDGEPGERVHTGDAAGRGASEAEVTQTYHRISASTAQQSASASDPPPAPGLAETARTAS